MDKGVHWIAGPLSYKTADAGVYPDRIVQICKWEFIGVTPAGEIRRWHLCFSLETKKFTSNPLTVTYWDKIHAKDLADIYRPIAVLRHMLPKGSVAVAMKSMLKPEDIAEVTAISLRGGRMDG
ncbi:hypothetical protein PMI07_000854 [Rhizobium sp. CF080]|uniref:hypothetical protein n=1 Tax=Rhizobium sp. (strain CF080) TaxID=1144310 RepID=UPI000271ACE4|nr:hypothetical protein [Rhizobium sp. CF080]EUB97278.1 hypothetical protein PMI07_000854 [Rhizobium sp. CF080]